MVGLLWPFPLWRPLCALLWRLMPLDALLLLLLLPLPPRWLPCMAATAPERALPNLLLPLSGRGRRTNERKSAAGLLVTRQLLMQALPRAKVMENTQARRLLQMQAQLPRCPQSWRVLQLQ